MATRTKTNAAQRAKWNRQLRRVTARAESSMRAAIKREFARQADGFNVGRHEAELTRIISDGYRSVANASYATARSMLAGKEARSETAKITWLQRVSEWVVSFANERARKIARESQRVVTETMKKAASEGLGTAGIASRIKEVLTGRISMSRAKVIARTEVGAAQNMAVQEAAKVSGIKYVQTWCSAEDAQTRPSHVAADGQTREEGELFDVGDAKLVRPCDPNGPAEEVIFCRCTILIEPVLEDDGGAILAD